MRVKHPRLAGVSKNVPDEIVQKWLDNGWTEAEASEPTVEPTPYDDLSDDEVSEAYATNVGGKAKKRETQVAALIALDAA
jgi:hypothetical protein